MINPIRLIDRVLRKKLQITEFSTHPECLFRAQIIESTHDVLVNDGTVVGVGERLIDLHFWNERLPVMSSKGADIAFARRLQRGLKISLTELCRHLRERADLDDVKVVRGNMSLGSAQRTAQIARIAMRYGFRQAQECETHLSPGEKIHRIGENILITLLVISTNPSALRSDTLRRSRTLTYLSRKTLEERFGR